jgi:AraC family L-rhamnose operon regulatory protein RhaS
MAVGYIEQHFCEPITAEEIAGEIGLNRSYLQTLFKSHTGKTVLEYINSLRIAKACFIMKNTDLSVVDIAVDCGFASRQHFMYTFKKHTGMTAKQFRGGTKDYERE